MDMLEIVKFLLVPLFLTALGFIWNASKDNAKKIDAMESWAIGEERVRSIIADKAEALHLADKLSHDRLNRLENRLQHIEAKLDRIVELLNTK